MYDAIFKVIIFGDAGCGKTTLRKRFMTNKFISSSQQTIGVDFETTVLKMNGTVVKLLIWDFAGEEKFRFIFPQYIYGASGGILMYDITNYSSFSHIGEWISVINETRENFPIILLGSKSDLDSYREISRKEGEKVAKLMDLSEFLECSSKTGENVKESFTLLTSLMLNGTVIKNSDNQSNSNLFEALKNNSF
jgi:small GTP-binding protein